MFEVKWYEQELMYRSSQNVLQLSVSSLCSALKQTDMHTLTDTAKLE